MKSAFMFLILTVPLFAAEVENGLKPVGKAMTIQFTEEVRIAPGVDNPELLWSGARSTVQVNNAGHMFVLDENGNRLIEFAPDGSLVRTIGQKGEGPGEYNEPISFSLLADQSAVITEYKGYLPLFNFLDKDMAFVDRKLHADKGLILHCAIFSPTGKHLFGYTMKAHQDGTATIGGAILDNDVNVIIPFPKARVDMITQEKMTKPDFWENYMADWFKLAPTQQPLVSFDDDGMAFAAMNGKYEITRYNAEMKTDLVFSKKYKPKPLSDGERESLVDAIRDQVMTSLPPMVHQFITETRIRKAVELADFPPNKSALFGLIPTNDGGVLALSDFDKTNNKSTVDIFDKDGKFVGTAKLPPVSVNTFASYFGIGPRMLLKNGKAYVIEVDEDEEMSLVRYGYKLVPAE